MLTRDAAPAESVLLVFRDHVRRTPSAPALRERDHTVTYARLDEHARRIAAAIVERGVVAGTSVPLIADRSLGAVAGALGIMLSGCAYVPIVPGQPEDRLRHIVHEVAAPVVLTFEHDRAALASLGLAVLALDEEGLPAPLAEPVTVAPDDAAYVMYTSGSTGRPKGVVVRHRNLAAYTSAIVALTGASARPLTFATTATLAADLGNTAVFPALASGGSLRILGYETALDGVLLERELGADPVDVLKITPSNLRVLLASAHDPRTILPREMLICGGESLTWDLVRRVRESGATCAIVNHYGPTETTVGALVHRVRDDESGAAHETVPLGTPLPGVHAYVLGEDMCPCAAGETGELFIGGVGVARGYVGRPEETAARFLPDPFVSDRATIYRTGDRVRFLANGELGFAGRVDDQVKIRGYRVEPGEIEAILSAHPAVRAVAIIPREQGETVLDAFVVGGMDVDDLRAYAAERLPEYMIPRTWTPLAALPLTANGKVDRSALRVSVLAAPANDVGAMTPTEVTIARIWCDVLERTDIGRDDDFFALGGHSLSATIAVAHIRSAFAGADVTLRAFFREPTLAAVAALVDAEQARTSEARLGAALDAVDALSDDEVRALLAEGAQ